MPARPPSPLILVVEDNPADIYLLRRALAQAYQAGTIQVIDNGDQAWRSLRREAPYTDAPTPALLTLDMNLPARHGGERRHYPDWGSLVAPSSTLEASAR